MRSVLSRFILLGTLAAVSSRGLAVDHQLELLALLKDDHYVVLVANAGERETCVEEVLLGFNAFFERFDGEQFQPYRSSPPRFMRFPRPVRLGPFQVTGERVHRETVTLLFGDITPGGTFRLEYMLPTYVEGPEG